jgi:hypothetical protein
LEKYKNIPREKLIYIDETSIQTQRYRRYARSKRGKRINIRISSQHHARIFYEAEEKVYLPMADYLLREI